MANVRSLRVVEAVSEVIEWHRRVEDHVVTFSNPYAGGEATNTVYVATATG